MKPPKLLSLLLAGTTLLGSLFYSNKVNAIPKDKELHLWAGLGIGFISYPTGQALEKLIFGKSRIHGFFYSVAGASSAGLAKEFIHDKYMGKGCFEWEDFYYTLAGGVASGIVLTGIESLLKWKKPKQINIGIDPKQKQFYLSYKQPFSFN